MNAGFLGPHRRDFLFSFLFKFLRSIERKIKHLPHRSIPLSRDGAYDPIPGDPGRLVLAQNVDVGFLGPSDSISLFSLDLGSYVELKKTNIYFREVFRCWRMVLTTQSRTWPGRLVQAQSLTLVFFGPVRLHILLSFGLGILGGIGSNITYLSHRIISLSRDGAFKPILGDAWRLFAA